MVNVQAFYVVKSAKFVIKTIFLCNFNIKIQQILNCLFTCTIKGYNFAG
jgi:hypothetical protein